MAVAQGQCPSCGSPIEFSVGSSVSKVCEYCRATIYRGDRGLESLGKVADIANTPSLIAVGDQGKLGGRPFEVLGRVQLDHGKGPWDEYYVTYDYGKAWGWLAYAEGLWFASALWPERPPVPPYSTLRVELEVPLGSAGVFRVAEVRTGTIVSAEGELPGAFPPGFVRHYADLHGVGGAFATLDYGDNRDRYEIFMGRWFDERQMEVTQVGPRTAHKVKLAQIRCPSCGGDLPKLSGERAERIGCRYCGAVSDIASQQIIAQQEAARQQPDIPIGARGTLDQVDYVCIAYMRRSADFDGERFGWDEYLLWSQGLGYRWLVKDESSWMWVMPINLAELDLRGMPRRVSHRERMFSLRNQSVARVDYVLGEVYWKCEVGEETRASDYISGRELLSREESPGEVRWSYSAPVPWPVLAQAFGVPVEGPGGDFAPEVEELAGPVGAASMRKGLAHAVFWLFVLFFILFVFGGGFFPVPVFGGSGSYSYGGK